jgi:hypothetical protein
VGGWVGGWVGGVLCGGACACAQGPPLSRTRTHTHLPCWRLHSSCMVAAWCGRPLRLPSTLVCAPHIHNTGAPRDGRAVRAVCAPVHQDAVQGRRRARQHAGAAAGQAHRMPLMRREVAWSRVVARAAVVLTHVASCSCDAVRERERRR